MIELRPYQADLARDIRAAWEGGARNVLAVLPTGGGKTTVLSHLVASNTGGSVVFAHRSELVAQISLALGRNGVPHRVIAPAAVQSECDALHLSELGRRWRDPQGRAAVAGVHTFVGLKPGSLHWGWLQSVTLWICDESHHLAPVGNVWGRAVSMLPYARGLGVTATPCRADGRGLGRHADGLMDAMVVGPGMPELMAAGYLCPYRILVPPSDIDLSGVAIGESGDYVGSQLRTAVHKSHITGDIVQHYLRHAPGKLGITFTVDVESAEETSLAFRAAGVPAEVLTGKTPSAVRARVMRAFRARQVLQIVNCDLLGEGTDVPAIEVVSFGRPTASYGLYCLDPRTEVLTARGWEKAAEALEAAEVIAFDPESGQCRTAEVTGRIRRPLLDGEAMYRLQSPHLDICVSDQHRLLVKSKSETSRHWQFQTAEAAAKRRSMFRVPVCGGGVFPGSGLSTAELEFLGWFLSDGTRNRQNNAISISQSSSKPLHLADIEDVLRRCGFKFGKYSAVRRGETAHCAPGTTFTISHGAPRGRDRQLRGYAAIAKWCDKTLPDCYDSLTRAELLTLLRTLNLGDGWNDHSSADWTPRSLRIACGGNRRLADRLQALCVTRGLRCNVFEYVGPAGRTWYTASIKDTLYATIAGAGVTDGQINGKSYKRNRLHASDAQPDFVWCLTNSVGTLITRRNGKVAIVGNCQQFGRALRPMAGKERALVLDHVGNVIRHGLPDAPRAWSLDRRERASRAANGAIPLTSCPQCAGAYERIQPACPYCGHAPEPVGRERPEQVQGDLQELDLAALAALRGEVARVDGAPRIPRDAGTIVAQAIKNRHVGRQQAQARLREAMAAWGGWRRGEGESLRVAQRRFYLTYGVDILTAQALGASDADALRERLTATPAVAATLQEQTT